jgi:hypothetical protein
LDEAFNLDIPRVCHVFSESDPMPKLYVTDNGNVTEGAGHTSIFFAQDKASFSLVHTLEPGDVVTELKLLRTGSETNYIVYCAVKIKETWMAVDLADMWMIRSAKQRLFDYLRSREKPGMATMPNYMYARTLRLVEAIAEWTAGEYEKVTVMFNGQYYTTTTKTSNQPPQAPWKLVNPKTAYIEYTFHLPVAKDKLKFPVWSQKAYRSGDVVLYEDKVYKAEQPTADSPPQSWTLVPASQGVCTGKSSMILYALYRANTQKFMGGAQRPWTIALGKANWFNHQPGQFLPVNLAAEPHWLYA